MRCYRIEDGRDYGYQKAVYVETWVGEEELTDGLIFFDQEVARKYCKNANSRELKEDSDER